MPRIRTPIGTERNGISLGRQTRFGHWSRTLPVSTRWWALRSIELRSALTPGSHSPVRQRWRRPDTLKVGGRLWRVEENRQLMQVRHFMNGPIRRFAAGAELYPEGTGSRLVFLAEIECVGVLGWLANAFGLLEREGDKRLAAIEKLIAQADNSPDSRARREGAAGCGSYRSAPSDALIADLGHDLASHGLALEACRVSAACADRGAAQHSPLGDGANLARNAGGHRGAVPRGSAFGYSRPRMGFIMSALPRRQIAGRTSARLAARCALLSCNIDYRPRLHAECGTDISPPALVAAFAGGRALPARARQDPARQMPGRSRPVRARALR